MYSCNLRRVPFDTSQWLTGLPCLNKIDSTWLEPDLKKLHQSWVFIKICLLLNFLTNNIVTGKCNCSNAHLWIQPSLQFFDNKTNLTCSRLSGCHAKLSGERCMTSERRLRRRLAEMIEKFRKFQVGTQASLWAAGIPMLLTVISLDWFYP